jgi:PleD family two-component response regulator
VSDLEEALQRLDPDALVVGGRFEAVTASDLCRMVRSSTGWQSLPIFVTLEDDEPGRRDEALEAGADDVSVRWRPGELAVRIRARTRHARMLRENASYDGLTGLLARGTFLDAAGTHLVEARRAWRALGVGMVRVDDDDEATTRTGLTRAAALLVSRFRPPHLLARWGTRELAVLATGPLAGNLGAELDDVRARLEHDFLWPSVPRISVATSHMPDDGITLPGLLREAAARL